MKKVIKGISYILSFVLTICVITLIICNILKTKLLNEDYVVEVLDKIGYYEKVSKNIESNFENYYYQSGLEHYVIENLFDENKVKEDSLKVVNALYNNTKTDVEIDIEPIKQNLRNNIDDMLEKQNKSIDASEEKTVDTFVNIIADTYESEITILKSGIKTISKTMHKLENLIEKINKIVVFVIIALVILIVVLNIKELMNICRYLGISALASGLIGTLINLAVRKSISINNIYALSRSLSEVIKYLLNDILGNIQGISIALIILGLVLILIHAFMQDRDKEERKYSRSRH